MSIILFLRVRIILIILFLFSNKDYAAVSISRNLGRSLCKLLLEKKTGTKNIGQINNSLNIFGLFQSRRNFAGPITKPIIPKNNSNLTEFSNKAIPIEAAKNSSFNIPTTSLCIRNTAESDLNAVNLLKTVNVSNAISSTNVHPSVFAREVPISSVLSKITDTKTTSTLSQKFLGLSALAALLCLNKNEKEYKNLDELITEYKGQQKIHLNKLHKIEMFGVAALGFRIYATKSKSIFFETLSKINKGLNYFPFIRTMKTSIELAILGKGLYEFSKVRKFKNKINELEKFKNEILTESNKDKKRAIFDKIRHKYKATFVDSNL